jgi:hypothetical protein
MTPVADVLAGGVGDGSPAARTPLRARAPDATVGDAGAARTPVDGSAEEEACVDGTPARRAEFSGTWFRLLRSQKKLDSARDVLTGVGAVTFALYDRNFEEAAWRRVLLSRSLGVSREYTLRDEEGNLLHEPGFGVPHGRVNPQDLFAEWGAFYSDPRDSLEVPPPDAAPNRNAAPNPNATRPDADAAREVRTPHTRTNTTALNAIMC